MLAKKFIEYFISVREENGVRRLRHPSELRDALGHILAITFTNKATNEMKLRIIDKLDALGHWTPDVPVKDVDYLAEFMDSFSTSPQAIASISRQALEFLLSDYGDFKVSTIDSFFQTVLRTFAFEADLDDTYQVELDSNYVAQMGLDTTLDSVETAGAKAEGVDWITDMMEERASSGSGWNIFQKSDSRNSIYKHVLNAGKNLSKEDFKVIREQLDDYFSSHPDFYATYHKLRHFYEDDLRRKHAAMRVAAKTLRDGFDKYGLDISETGGEHLATRSRKMAFVWSWNHNEDIGFQIPEFTRKGSRTRVFNPKKENPCLGTPVEDELEALAIKMFEAFDLWRKEALSDMANRWRIYSATMPYVGLLQNVRNNVRSFLNDSNIVELGETNSILNRIIGEDDAPFIYERMGSRLEHFLIDEFQDTSRLQWDNLKPLLSESEGKGNDNLIIGDAKQSIYRFRNADPSLISVKVPEEFADTCNECGYSPAENTNWRSSRRIVEFNNLFFRFLTKELSPAMERLYANTVQPPHHTGNDGYVKVQLFKSASGDDEDPAHYDDIPLMIADMIARGYEMRDIAILVDTKEQGADVIEHIMAYNRDLPPQERIDFISADSLSVGESPAVQAIVSILEAINNGTRAQLRPKEEWTTKGVGDWSRLKADFSFFVQRNPGVPLSELLNRFLNGEYDPDAIKEMLSTMTTTVLPALTENIIRNFISQRMRESEAPFIAAFQDCVLEFCEGKYADVTSFLNWWNSKGRFRSISSPEDANAVQIMTIHKSKGLEFRCVIIPYFKQTVKPTGIHEREWLWVTPDLHEASDVAPIPWIPVLSEDSLAESPHADAYAEYLSKYMTDKVNMAYVAFTRAIDELYIFIPHSSSKNGEKIEWRSRIGEYLWRLGHEADEVIGRISSECPQDRPYIPEAGLFVVDDENKTLEFGQMPSAEDVARAAEASKKKTAKTPSIPVQEYWCAESLPPMLYQDPTDADGDILPVVVEKEPDDSAESEEVRAYGEVMHRIMEYIETENDIRFALNRAKIHGVISFRDIPDFKVRISEALESVRSYGWFASGCKVINERGLSIKGRLMRPDRIMIRPDGTAVIVDYKFGTHRDDARYSRQVRKYARSLVEAGVAPSCEAFVWYVTLGAVLPV